MSKWELWVIALLLLTIASCKKDNQQIEHGNVLFFNDVPQTAVQFNIPNSPIPNEGIISFLSIQNRIVQDIYFATGKVVRLSKLKTNLFFKTHNFMLVTAMDIETNKDVDLLVFINKNGKMVYKLLYVEGWETGLSAVNENQLHIQIYKRYTKAKKIRSLCIILNKEKNEISITMDDGFSNWEDQKNQQKSLPIHRQ